MFVIYHKSNAYVDQMLNNFCFHVYAQKSLSIGENDDAFFWTHIHHSTRARRAHRAGSQLKMLSSNISTHIACCDNVPVRLFDDRQLSYIGGGNQLQCLLS